MYLLINNKLKKYMKKKKVNKSGEVQIGEKFKRSLTALSLDNQALIFCNSNSPFSVPPRQRNLTWTQKMLMVKHPKFCSPKCFTHPRHQKAPETQKTNITPKPSYTTQ